MSYLVRKITRAKWEPEDELSPDEIPADAVTSDLRTSSNALSFWQLERPSNYDEVCRIALALATAAERIDRMDLTWIDENKISAQGISMKPSDGRTPVESLRGNHVDVTKLDLGRLSRIATWIAEALTQNQHKRFTKNELIRIIIKAVREGRVSINDLEPKVKEEIEKELGN
jgi:hypothetical protein